MNLILVIIDSLRQDHVGAYGNEWIKTPNLDAFCRESVLFNRAYPESLPTLPFRRSTFTGKRVFPFAGWEPYPAAYPFSEVFGLTGLIPGWIPIPHEDTPISELLTGRGYNTGLVTDCFHQHYPGMNYHRGYKTWQFIRGQEWDCWKSSEGSGERKAALPYMTEGMMWEERKTWELGRYLINNSPRHSEEDYFAPQVFRAASDWLADNYSNKDPFFLCIDCFDPHEPWDPPKYYTDLYDPGYDGIEVVMPLYSDKADSYLSEAELRHMRALYAGEVTMVDRWFGHFMDQVRLLGLEKDTVMVVVSDHGHQLGDKNFTGKLPWGLMPGLLDLVLAIRHPGGESAGNLCEAMVMNHDILPTVLRLMEEEIPEWVEGEDLWPIVKGEKTGVREYASSCFKDYYWLRNESYAMVCRSDWSEVELYCLQNDPEYLKDISKEDPKTVAVMKDLMLEVAGGELPIHTVIDPLLDGLKE